GCPETGSLQRTANQRLATDAGSRLKKPARALVNPHAISSGLSASGCPNSKRVTPVQVIRNEGFPQVEAGQRLVLEPPSQEGIFPSPQPKSTPHPPASGATARRAPHKTARR